MPCCICASDCKTFTTSLRKHEGTEDETEMEKIIVDRSRSHRGDSALYRHWRRNSTATVELADPNAVRLEADNLLGGGRAAGALPDPVRKPRLPRASFRFPAPHARAYVVEN